MVYFNIYQMKKLIFIFIDYEYCKAILLEKIGLISLSITYLNCKIKME